MTGAATSTDSLLLTLSSQYVVASRPHAEWTEVGNMEIVKEVKRKELEVNDGHQGPAGLNKRVKSKTKKAQCAQMHGKFF